MKRTKLNAWQMVALERALCKAIERGEIARNEGGETLLDVISNATRITITTAALQN